MGDRTIARNKKAWHNFDILERFEAGIALAGTEVKSLREGKCKIMDAYCLISDDFQLELIQMEISPYKFGNIHNHPPNRKRKLLMHRREIVRLRSKMKERSLTLIPLALYFKKDKVKLEVALARGKKLHDKRQSLKEKDHKLEIDRTTKQQSL